MVRGNNVWDLNIVFLKGFSSNSWAKQKTLVRKISDKNKEKDFGERKRLDEPVDAAQKGCPRS